MNDDSWVDESEYGLGAPGSGNSWRYGSKDRVVIGGRSLAVGVAVAHPTFCLLLAVQSPGGWALLFFIYSLLPVWVVGLAAGSLLGLVLRRIPNQWIHVAAFFLVPLLFCAPFGGLSPSGAIHFSMSIALAAGIGRLTIWKIVRIDKPYRASVPANPQGSEQASPGACTRPGRTTPHYKT
ncbi:hypothetical protein [Paenarthrobacter histidinolovorans]|uniref:hypothetical protein n=1 Tax=Paenarthrobacter histidinolovorans TaxID=43664 RepID=UPI00166F3DAA|nr:hypothetical protein [Paenarthrobacter histidinolovorans]GGJ31627.1 hypothetical protein GCM10010052_30580 [Paenarthrobacter histidinolovorans]